MGVVCCGSLLHSVTPCALAPTLLTHCHLYGNLLKWRLGWGGCDGMWSENGGCGPKLLLLAALLLLHLALPVCLGAQRAALLRRR